MEFILLVSFHAALIVFYNATSYIQSFLYNIDNHLLLKNCISLLISVSKLLFYLYPVKYSTILLNIYQQAMCKINRSNKNVH